MSRAQEKLREIFEQTVELDVRYDGPLKDMDYFGLMCKAASKESMHKLMGSNVCMFNCKLEEQDAVLILFCIPLNSSGEGVKHIAERVMETFRNVEECFTTIDFSHSKEVKEDKYMYISVIKKVEKEEEEDD